MLAVAALRVRLVIQEFKVLFRETGRHCHDGDDVCLCFLFCIAGKRYNALLVSYKNEEEAGIKKLNRMWMKSVLKEGFGYAVYDFDVMRGKGMHVRRSLIKITESLT